LWPLLHGRTDLLSYRREALQGYLAVNQRFCAQVLRVLRPDDLLWIHDYHLIPLASMLRARGVRNRIGFFLHTPLPDPRVLASLPRHQQLFGLLAAYDLVGLQTAGDAQALRAYLDDVAAERPAAQSSATAIRAFPIGTDPDALAAAADAAQRHVEVRELRDSLGDKALLIGVDRLDYSKGLPQRLHAFGRLLDLTPALREKATLLQVTPECRGDVVDYRRLSREIQRIVGAINGHHAAPTWTPIRYVNQSYPHEVLAGFYRLARAAVVTPLRDGMNLVAKEYLACQAAADPGVLVLSEFAGAAHELGGSAMLVNPYDIEGCADAMACALAMPIEERRNRWSHAMKRLRTGNVHTWCEGFLAALAAIAPGSGRPRDGACTDSQAATPARPVVADPA
jgi:trehalose 6-phosphate synthase